MPVALPSHTHLMTTADVAARAGVHVATVNRWADTGALPVAWRSPGRRGARYFAGAAVDEFLAQRTAA